MQEDLVQKSGNIRGRFRRRSKAVRRMTGMAALLFALVAIGFGYAALAPGGNGTAVASSTDPALIAKGKQLYDTTCITCHGANLQGVKGRGVPLIGVGQAAVYFQLATGRMPAKANGAEMPPSIPVFKDEVDPKTGVNDIDAIAAYVQSMGGGPQIPSGLDKANLKNAAALSKGAELYRLNCASCHNFTGKGGALSQGKYAPPLTDATPKEIYGAMLSGPENMPTFSDAQLTPTEKKAIITYVVASQDTQAAGGYDLGGFGPAPEGLIAFLVGMGAIVAVTLWSGSRS